MGSTLTAFKKKKLETILGDKMADDGELSDAELEDGEVLSSEDEEEEGPQNPSKVCDPLV